MMNNLSELLQQLPLLAGLPPQEAIPRLSQMVGEDIKVRFEDSSESSNRILLTSLRARANFARQLARQCNGIVLEYPSWKVLSMPHSMLSQRFSAAELCKHIDNYDIYDIKDGTTITLYYYKEQWCMSSTNGFEVSAFQWIGPMTYKEIFEQLIQQYPEFSYDRLDKTHSYTIGMRHQSFHPLLTDPASMWLIQSCDLSMLNTCRPDSIHTDTDIGLPLQYPSNGLPTLPPKALLNHLTAKNAAAMTRYMTTRATNKPDIHYGYILKSKDQSRPDIVLESELLKKIRGLLYNLPKGHLAPNINAQNRCNYAVLRAYLSADKRVFIDLFPQFITEFKRYDSIFQSLITKVMCQLNRKTIDQVVSLPPLSTLAVRLAAYIREHCDINAMNADGYSIVSNFIVDKRYLDMYFTCISREHDAPT